MELLITQIALVILIVANIVVSSRLHRLRGKILAIERVAHILASRMASLGKIVNAHDIQLDSMLRALSGPPPPDGSAPNPALFSAVDPAQNPATFPALPKSAEKTAEKSAEQSCGTPAVAAVSGHFEPSNPALPKTAEKSAEKLRKPLRLVSCVPHRPEAH